jgi:predicted RNA binding protein YcfA (HicA-like mRNA interferase family)
LPAITGKQLIRLLELTGWTRGRRSEHGITFSKHVPGSRPLFTVVPDKRSVLPDGTLGAILGMKQSRIGRDGLAARIKEHGLHEI